MAKQRDIQEGGIVFGDWKLVPVDSRNWELCHWHAAVSGKGDGTVKWNRLGRFYSYGTLDEALRYVADEEMKAKHADRVAEISAALMEYENITHRLVDAVAEAVRRDGR